MIADNWKRKRTQHTVKFDGIVLAAHRTAAAAAAAAAAGTFPLRSKDFDTFFGSRHG